MKIKLLCPEPDSFSLKGLEYARTFANLTAVSLSQEEFDKLAPEYNAVLVRFNTKVGTNILQNESNIKAVISPTTGLDHIDTKSAKSLGVKVFHLQEERRFLNTINGTAELSVGLMLAVMRNIPQSYAAVKDGVWDTGPFRGNEVAGKTLGIIGCGRLGSKVSRTAVSLGMNVVAYDPNISRFPAGVSSQRTQSKVFSVADVISLHVPLLPKTKHMIADREINQMKNGVVIINTSRGAIIETSALLSGLKQGKVYAAAVDVMEDEHLQLGNQHPLVKYACEYENLIITPHIGGATFESVERTDLFILKKYEKEIGKIHE